MKHCSSCGPIRYCSWLALGVCVTLAACTTQGALPPGQEARDQQASGAGSRSSSPALLGYPAVGAGASPAGSSGRAGAEGANVGGLVDTGASAESSALASTDGNDTARALQADGVGTENGALAVPEVRFTALAGSKLSVDVARGLLRFVSDPAGDPWQVVSVGPAAAVPYGGGLVTILTTLGGTLTVGADGAFEYEPPAGLALELDRVPFSIVDGRGGSIRTELVIGISPGAFGSQPGFEISGGSGELLVGSSVSGVGDFNGDGLDDMLITARAADRDVGYLLLGSRLPGNVGLGDLNPAEGRSVRFLAETPGLDALSVAVSPAGHVNDDRFADLIIGVHQEPIGAGPGGARGGKAYVIFGSETPPAEINLATLEAEQRGFVIIGAAGQDRLGFSVAGAGNVNGSGGDDLLLGAVGGVAADAAAADVTSRISAVNAAATEEPSPSDGKAYVVFGKNTFTPVNLANLGVGGYRLDGEAGEAGATGTAVTGLGDWNGDGRADIAVSAPQLNGGGGRVYIAYGRPFAGVVELGDVAFGVGGYAIDGQGESEQAGRTLQNGGNLGGSELPDLIIGSPNPAGIPSAGKTVVVYGTPDGDGLQLAQIEAEAPLGFVVRAEAAADRSGLAVAAPGDFNGDGASDLLIGASEQGAEQAGAAYLLFGSSALRAGLELLALPAEAGLTLRGQPPAGARLGFSAAAAGDVNGDDYPDVILGAPQHDGSLGRAYVLLGHP